MRLCPHKELVRNPSTVLINCITASSMLKVRQEMSIEVKNLSYNKDPAFSSRYEVADESNREKGPNARDWWSNVH